MSLKNAIKKIKLKEELNEYGYKEIGSLDKDYKDWHLLQIENSIYADKNIASNDFNVPICDHLINEINFLFGKKIELEINTNKISDKCAESVFLDALLPKVEYEILININKLQYVSDKKISRIEKSDFPIFSLSISSKFPEKLSKIDFKFEDENGYFSVDFKILQICYQYPFAMDVDIEITNFSIQ